MENLWRFWKRVAVTSLFVNLIGGPCFAQMQSALDGEWKSACLNQGSDYSIYNLQIASRAWVYTAVAFEDMACRRPYIQYEEVRDVTIVNGTDVDLKTLTLYYTPRTDGTARALNQARFCGRQDWKLNQRQEVEAKACSSVHLPQKGQIFYSRYRFTGPELWLGVASAGHDGLKPETRFSQLQDFSYEKVAE